MLENSQKKQSAYLSCARNHSTGSLRLFRKCSPSELVHCRRCQFRSEGLQLCIHVVSESEECSTLLVCTTVMNLGCKNCPGIKGRAAPSHIPIALDLLKNFCTYLKLKTSPAPDTQLSRFLPKILRHHRPHRTSRVQISPRRTPCTYYLLMLRIIAGGTWTETIHLACISLWPTSYTTRTCVL